MGNLLRWGEAAATCALLLVTTLSCGAVTRHNAAKDAAATEKWASEELAKAEALLLWPKCEIPAKPGQCGLETERWLEQESLQRFIQNTCKADPSAPIADACRSQFQTAALDAVRVRANLSKREEVDGYCRSNPEECSDLQHIELLYMRSHNAVVFARRQRIIDAANEKKASIHAVAELQAQMFDAIGEGLKESADAYGRPNSVRTRMTCTDRGNSQTCVGTVRY